MQCWQRKARHEFAEAALRQDSAEAARVPIGSTWTPKGLVMISVRQILAILRPFWGAARPGMMRIDEQHHQFRRVAHRGGYLRERWRCARCSAAPPARQAWGETQTLSRCWPQVHQGFFLEGRRAVLGGSLRARPGARRRRCREIWSLSVGTDASSTGAGMCRGKEIVGTKIIIPGEETIVSSGIIIFYTPFADLPRKR